MKITMPEKVVDVCDFCSKEGFLEKCVVCKRQFCLVDGGDVAASWGFTELCRECAKRDDVGNVCKQYASKLTLVFKKRNAALGQLPIVEPDVSDSGLVDEPITD